MSAILSHAPSTRPRAIEHVPAFHVHTRDRRGCKTMAWPLGRGECIVQLGFREGERGIMRETCRLLARCANFLIRSSKFSLCRAGRNQFEGGRKIGCINCLKNTTRPLTGSTGLDLRVDWKTRLL